MKSDPTYQIELKKKTNWVLTIYLFVCLIVWSVVTIGFIYAAIDWGIIDQLAFPIFCLLIAGIFIIDRILWQLIGKETLGIGDHIEIFKTGKLFSSKNSIQFEEFSYVSFSDDKKDISFFARIYGLRGGKITIHYLGRKTRFGQSLSIQEAESIAKVISDEIDKAKTIYRDNQS